MGWAHELESVAGLTPGLPAVTLLPAVQFAQANGGAGDVTFRSKECGGALCSIVTGVWCLRHLAALAMALLGSLFVFFVLKIVLPTTVAPHSNCHRPALHAPRVQPVSATLRYSYLVYPSV